MKNLILHVFLMIFISVKAIAATPVDLSNYKVAESDVAFGNITKLAEMNTFFHFPVGEFDLNNQTVVRMNQDTTYSGAIVNVSKGASITLPETNGCLLYTSPSPRD